jgi:hypothetical protein
MSEICEVKSITIYRNCSGNTVYLTLQKYKSKEFFAGKKIYGQLPEYLLDPFLCVKVVEKPIGTYNHKERVGKEYKTVEINQFELEQISALAPNI